MEYSPAPKPISSSAVTSMVTATGPPATGVEERAGRADDRPPDRRRADPEPARGAGGEQVAHQEARGAAGEGETQQRRAQPQLAGHVQQEHRQDHVVEELPGAPRTGQRAQEPVAGHEPEPLDDLAPGARPPRDRRRGRLPHPHEPQAQRRGGEGQRVGEDGEGRGERLHQDARQPRPRQLRGRPAQAQLAVRFQDPVARHHRQEERCPGDAGGGAQDAGEEPDRVELLDAERAQEVGERHHPQEGAAPQVRGDQDGALAAPIDPDAHRQPDQQRRRPLGRRQEPHLRRAGPEDQRGGQGQREQGDLRAERGDRLPGPEREERAVAPQAGESWLPHLALLTEHTESRLPPPVAYGTILAQRFSSSRPTPEKREGQHPPMLVTLPPASADRTVPKGGSFPVRSGSNSGRGWGVVRCRPRAKHNAAPHGRDSSPRSE